MNVSISLNCIVCYLERMLFVSVVNNLATGHAGQTKAKPTLTLTLTLIDTVDAKRGDGGWHWHVVEAATSC